ncbi:MAG: hypothetical protein U1E05_04395 [Patescibacteria group bacterium]|nr:hypothetical protein [Patescibacteria group bacterium]
MVDIEQQPIDPHFRERRERIATAVLAQLVGTEGKFRPEHTAMALEAADALIDALD